MKTVNIKGKEYVEVHERIKFFRENQEWNNWGMDTTIIELNDTYCVLKVTITDNTGRVISSGIAREVNGDSYINKTSYVENCETSARGRALSGLAIGIDTSVASADEVRNAIAQQNQPTDKKTTQKKPLDQRMLDKVITGLVALLDCEIDRNKVEQTIKELHGGKLPTTLVGVDTCVKELTVTGMKERLIAA